MRQPRRSKEEWRKIINDFINSGVSKKDYCEEKELQTFSFNHWYYKLRGKQVEKQVTTEVKPDFIRLKIEDNRKVLQYEQRKEDNKDSMNQSGEVGAIKIILRSGIKIEVITNNILKLVKELNYVV